IIQRTKEGRANVLLDIGFEQELDKQFVIPISGAIAQPSLYINDCVLVRNYEGSVERWLPAIVYVLPHLYSLPPQFYTVQIHSSEIHLINARRNDLMKISRGLYQRICIYIQRVTPPVIIDDNKIVKKSDNEIRLEQIDAKIIALQQKLERMRKDEKKRYKNLEKKIDEQIAIMNDNKNHPSTILPETKSEFSQIPTPTRSPSTTPEIRPQNRSSQITPRSPTPPLTTERIIALGTYVVCRWEDDDGLFYPGEFVLALYSRNVSYWAPGVLIPNRTTKENKDEITVRFYDCKVVQMDMKAKEVIKIPEKKFEQYVDCIIQKEKSIVHQVVVGRKGETKTYMLGTVKERVEDGHHYRIEWYDGTEDIRDISQLYGAFTRQGTFQNKDKVLALDETEYKPATIIQVDKKSLSVQFFDSKREKIIPLEATFQITDEDYYKIIGKSIK
ncbi:unnamed protein product, partial [Didymodactylos carnosus]